VTLLASALPEVIWQEIAGAPPLQLYWIKAGLLLVLFAFTWLTGFLRPLRWYIVLLFVLEIGWGFQVWLMRTGGWEAWEAQVAWVPGMLVIQLIEVSISLVIILITLLIFRKSRREVYLAAGNLRAEAAPVRWLGQRKPSTWPEFGGILAGALFFGGLLFLWLLNPPTGRVLGQVLPLLPGVVLLSAVNALDEELIYRVGLMRSIEEPAGKSGALWASAVFFGMAHYSGGFPGGLPWFLLTGFIGYMLGKSMQESRGMFWAWLIHLITDVPVFAFSAMATLAARGF